MPRKGDLLYFGHMFETSRKIGEKIAGLSRESFDRDENLRLALLHLVQVIGEAARESRGRTLPIDECLRGRSSVLQ